jgi:hypothetical protein
MVDFYVIFFHVAFILGIAISVYLVIGAFNRKFGEKHYQMRKRYLPFLLFPKTEKNFTISYKILVTFMLIFLVIMYILFFLFGLLTPTVN